MSIRASVDLGSNSTRLLIADPEHLASGAVLAREMRITRMGAGVDHTKQLQADAIKRVTNCLLEFRQQMEGFDVEAVRVVATSAARDAQNRESLFDAVEATLGVRPALLSGEREAELSFRGATSGLSATAQPPYLIFDIGGGSTEFVFGIDSPAASISVDMGCVRFSERFIESDPPRAEELSNAIGFAKDYMTDVLQAIPEARRARTLIGLAGTVSAAVRVLHSLDQYDRARIHHAWLSREDVESVFRELATATQVERLETPGVEPERAQVLVGGMCVLVAVLRTLDCDRILHSEADLLDGALLATDW